MIVKNERDVIRRALRSVKKIIDYWVIVDTGSNDGTQEILREFMGDVPGELHERPWVDFAHNRNEALELALDKSDYILFLDADEEWAFSKELDKSKWESDFYLVKIRDCNFDLHRVLLIKNGRQWRWEGVLHEEIRPLKDLEGQILEGVTVYGLPRDGNRAKESHRYYKDAEILEKAFKRDPTNARSAFYLAQSYATAGDKVSALKYYQIRAQMGGFRDEVFWSLFCIGCLQDELKYDSETIVASYCKAYLFDQSRAEPLHHLASFYHSKEEHLLGYIVASHALSLPLPEALTFVFREVYDYSLLLKKACCAHFIGKFDEAKKDYIELLGKAELPENLRRVVEMNLDVLEKFEAHRRKKQEL